MRKESIEVPFAFDHPPTGDKLAKQSIQKIYFAGLKAVRQICSKDFFARRDVHLSAFFCIYRDLNRVGYFAVCRAWPLVCCADIFLFPAYMGGAGSEKMRKIGLDSVTMLCYYRNSVTEDAAVEKNK